MRDLIYHPKYGTLRVIENSPRLVRVVRLEEEDPEAEAFWMSREELEKFNWSATPKHLQPTRQPVASDLPWQAYLREHATIFVQAYEGHIDRAVRMIEKVSGVRYDKEDTGFQKISSKELQWYPSFRMVWPGEIPAGLPCKVLRDPKNKNKVVNNQFVLDLLGLGFVFGWGK